MIGTTLGHFRILEKLGAGGMGEVYLARDEQLQRDVALKVLSAETLPDQTARARLLQEARAASALNHAHICTIHEVGEAGGQVYIVMERVEGRPLKELIPAGGLPAEAVLRYGAQIADALAHAHERGIIHRDLKTLNVVLTPAGQVKVLDFGLAKRISGSELDQATRSQKSLTEAGAIVGTLTYMAPEVLRGEPADARSDIWALGVVLYEMAAGQMPFRGQTGFELSSAILREPPMQLPASIPSGLRAIIQRCLAKEPGQRYQHAGEIRAVLEAIEPAAASAAAPVPATQTAAASPQARARRAGRGWLWLGGAAALAGVLAVAFALSIGGLRGRLAGPAPRGQIQSLAVLPLNNFSGDAEQEYFADGMTEELITDLAKIGALKVISRTSVMQYKGTKKTVPEIARELNVDGVIEGSVQRSGDRVRITAQLIEARTDRHIWAESYERDLRDVLRLQGEVASAIAEQINAKLTTGEKTSLAAARPINPEAYELYLQAVFYLNKRNKEGILKSRDLFQHSIEKDPTYAPAYAGLSDALCQAGDLSLLPLKDAFEQARAAAEKAMALNDQSAEAHTALGRALQEETGQATRSESEFRKAIQLNPNYAFGRYRYGMFLAYWGKLDESLNQMERAHELDPLSRIINANIGYIRIQRREYDRAVQYLQKLAETDPDSSPAHYQLANAYEAKGMIPEAITEEEKGNLLFGYPEQAVHKNHDELRKAYASGGVKGYLRKKIEIVREYSRDDPDRPFELAQLFARLGQTEEVLRYLDEARRANNLSPGSLQSDWAFDGLRSDPRFQEFVRQLGSAR